jgi:hypothetical protein
VRNQFRCGIDSWRHRFHEKEVKFMTPHMPKNSHNAVLSLIVFLPPMWQPAGNGYILQLTSTGGDEVYCIPMTARKYGPLHLCFFRAFTSLQLFSNSGEHVHNSHTRV